MCRAAASFLVGPSAYAVRAHPRTPLLSHGCDSEEIATGCGRSGNGKFRCTALLPVGCTTVQGCDNGTAVTRPATRPPHLSTPCAIVGGCRWHASWGPGRRAGRGRPAHAKSSRPCSPCRRCAWPSKKGQRICEHFQPHHPFDHARASATIIEGAVWTVSTGRATTNTTATVPA